MEKRKLLIAISLVLAVSAASLGVERAYAAAQSQDTTQTQVKKKSATHSQKKGKLSKRNQAKVDQAEQYRLRHEKIKSEQGK